MIHLRWPSSENENSQRQFLSFHSNGSNDFADVHWQGAVKIEVSQRLVPVRAHTYRAYVAARQHVIDGAKLRIIAPGRKHFIIREGRKRGRV